MIFIPEKFKFNFLKKLWIKMEFKLSYKILTLTKIIYFFFKKEKLQNFIFLTINITKYFQTILHFYNCLYYI